MADTTTDLISMADIARLAGQSRATVGNWKRREGDFPGEHSKGPRGPLYDRRVIEAWLIEKGRLEAQAEEFDLFRITDRMRGDATVSEVHLLLLVLIGLRTALSDDAWSALVEAKPTELDGLLRSAVDGAIPFTENLLPRWPIGERAALEAVSAVSYVDLPRLPDAADSLLDALFGGHGGQRAGFGTSKTLRTLMVALAGRTGSVYDPAAGTAQLLVDAAARSEGPTPDLFGQEVSAESWAVAQLNLLIHGLKGHIELGQVLHDDLLRDVRADRIVADPPWNVHLEGSGIDPDDPRWIWGDPSYGDTNMAWVQHCLYHLADGGRAVVALPPKVLFDKSRSALAMQGIIKSGYLDAVISLPAGLMPSRSLRCALLVFVKGRPLKDGRPAPTMMVNVDDGRADGTGRIKSLAPGLIDDIAEAYEVWRMGEASISDVLDLEWVDYEELAANDFDLDPRRYVEPPANEVDTVEMAAIHRTLTRKLAETIGACNKADTALMELMKEEY